MKSWTVEQVALIHFLESLLLSDHMGDAWEAAYALAEKFDITFDPADTDDVRRFVRESGVARYYRPEDDDLDS